MLARSVFHEPVLRKLNLGKLQRPKEVYVLPKFLDEEVARLHLEKVGAKLVEFPSS